MHRTSRELVGTGALARGRSSLLRRLRAALRVLLARPVKRPASVSPALAAAVVAQGQAAPAAPAAQAATTVRAAVAVGRVTTATTAARGPPAARASFASLCPNAAVGLPQRPLGARAKRH